jgi:suppressor of ftsI/bilirubin oxidase
MTSPKHSFNRRQWLRMGAAGAASALVPASWPTLHAAEAAGANGCDTATAFTLPLFVPGMDGAGGRLVLGPDTIVLKSTARDGALAFNATTGTRRFTNPTLATTTGAIMRITLDNALPEPTVVHWHGLAVDTRNDGNGETLVQPGAQFRYEFAVRNRGGLYWYHPHPHGSTARQVAGGLFGLLDVDDDEQRALREALELTPGDTELTLVLQDRRAGDGNRYAPAPEDELYGWYGCLPHVNGVLRPFHRVAARRYRLRILNASNARTYRLALRRDNGSTLPVLLLGTDGGLLERPVACTELLVSPAERVDVLADFGSTSAGDFVILESRAFDPMQAAAAVPPAPATAGASGDHAHDSVRTTGSLPDGAPFALMQFRIGGPRSANPPVPSRLSRMPQPQANADESRPLRLGFAKGRWRINDRVYDPAATPIEVPRAARETWLLRNYHASAPHAMHLHGFQFHVLERETSPDFLAALAVDAQGRLPTDLGLKDTVLVWPGESVRIAIDFRHPFAEAQTYLLHCHNLEHEDAGMMLRVRVG